MRNVHLWDDDPNAHPQTLADGRIAHPFRVGLTNTLIALAAVVIGIGARMAGKRARDGIDWRIVAAVPLGIAVVAFAHAYLGARIGGRRANNIFVILLLAVLIGGMWLFTRYIDRP